MTPEDEARLIGEVAGRLGGRFPDVPAHVVVEVVDHIYHQLDSRPIRDYVPVLVERAARDRLSHLTAAT